MLLFVEHYTTLSPRFQEEHLVCLHGVRQVGCVYEQPVSLEVAATRHAEISQLFWRFPVC